MTLGNMRALGEVPGIIARFALVWWSSDAHLLNEPDFEKTQMLTGPQRRLLRSYSEREHVIHGRQRGPDHLRLVELLCITEHPVNGELLIK
jgi:hypothetical protein